MINISGCVRVNKTYRTAISTLLSRIFVFSLSFFVPLRNDFLILLRYHTNEGFVCTPIFHFIHSLCNEKCFSRYAGNLIRFFSLRLPTNASHDFGIFFFGKDKIPWVNRHWRRRRKQQNPCVVQSNSQGLARALFNIFGMFALHVHAFSYRNFSSGAMWILCESHLKKSVQRFLCWEFAWNFCTYFSPFSINEVRKKSS